MLGRVFSSLRVPAFRKLWISMVFSGAGRWSLTLGLGWFMEILTHSPFWVGLAMFTIQGPALLGAPLFGLLTDRFDRRVLTAATPALAALASLGLMAIAFAGKPAPLLVVGLGLAAGLGTSMSGIASSTLLPSLVPRSELLNAISMRGISSQGAEFVGPAAASPLLALFGVPAVFLLCAVFYAVAAVTPMLITRFQGPPAPTERGFVRPLRQGVRYVRSYLPIGLVIMMVGLHCPLTMAYMGLLPGFVQTNLHAGAVFYGLLMTLVGCGAITGMLLLAGVPDHEVRAKWYLVSAIVSGLALVLLGSVHSEVLAGIAALFIGASQAVFMALSLTRIQELVSDDLRGRVTSLYFFVAMGTMAIANWGFGALDVRIAAPAILMTVGLAFAAVVILVNLRYSLVQNIYGRQQPREVAADTLSLSPKAGA